MTIGADHPVQVLPELPIRAAFPGLRRHHGNPFRFIAGIDIEGFPPPARAGARVCLAARKYGLLTRPIRDTIVLMPPYCITRNQLQQAVEAIRWALDDIAHA